MDLIFGEVIPTPEPFLAELQKIKVPADLCSEFEKQDRESVIQQRIERFNRQAQLLWRGETEGGDDS